ncbi:hypothetical protein [Amycolatopsis sp. DG1A-15b]|uniref:hypothetical protein n=1 Tax=Amycolatopsis sp. DG1A-15b TaxID=3052846 RepID=UPI00255C20BF|nr:hypothetical protein [Amycolatopsis sp. DG1A-15b]WIX92330.1 hypothetical protein QRY02_18535 [Amycolatopsis sp. DG1A-15b]
MSPSFYFRTNIFLTPCGILSRRYLRWAKEVTAGRIVFSTEYPFVPPPRRR